MIFSICITFHERCPCHVLSCMFLFFLVLFVYVILLTTVRGTMPPQGHLALFFSSLFSFSYILQMLIIVFTFVLFFLLKMEMNKIN